MNRRDFHKSSLVATTGLLTFPSAAFSLRAKPQMALQLWTVRELMEEDLEQAINLVAHVGFGAVETADFPEGTSLEKSSSLIQDYGMGVCGMHVEIPTRENKNELFEMAEAYRCKKLIWHGWPRDDRYNTSEGIEELAGIYNEAQQIMGEKELSFGLHNHWWEYQPNPEGKIPFNEIQQFLDKEVFFEIDTYWAKVAGQDPATIVENLGSRAEMLHIKDGPARYTENLENDEPEPMVAVGSGTQDFNSISEKSDAKWWIVELDRCETDMMEAVAESYLYLKKQKFAKGKI